jgi:type 1 glutamine amidotransferase
MKSISRRKFVVHSAHTSIGVSAGFAAWDWSRAAGAEASPATAGAKRLDLCLVSGSLEYKSDASLAAFEEYVQKRYSIRCHRAFIRSEEDLPGLEQLDRADCMLLFTRRLRLPASQIDRVKAYCRRGGSIVGIRTASHAFQTWLALDKEVLGGDYSGHYGNADKPKIELAASGKGHPILRGVTPYVSSGSLYRNAKIASDTTVLLTGSIPGHQEPVAWTRTHRGGRVFYTSLGDPDDFQHPSFLSLVVNAILWTTRRPMETLAEGGAGGQARSE